MDRRGNTEFVLGGLNMQNGRAKRSARREIEGKGDCREDALVVDGKGGVGMLVMGEGAERDKLSGLRRNVNRLERVRAGLEFRRDFQHNVILVEAFVNVGDLPLAEGVAESVVNVQHGDSETAGGVAIDDDDAFEPVHLLVGIDVAQLRNLGQALLNNGSPMSEIVEIVGLESVLILRGAAAPAHERIRAMTWSALSFRSLSGLSWENRRAVLPPLPPPVKEITESTAGSCETMSVKVRIFFDMAAKERSWSPIMLPLMRPVSCWGKNPLGVWMKR